MVLSNMHFTLVEKESSKVNFNEWDDLSPLVEVPVQSYAWESYHSSLNQAGGIVFPNSEICQRLNLKYQNGEPDLYDNDGVASIFRNLTSKMII